MYEHVYETVDVEGNAEIRANATAKVDRCIHTFSIIFMILASKGCKQLFACLSIYLYFCSYLLFSKQKPLILQSIFLFATVQLIFQYHLWLPLALEIEICVLHHCEILQGWIQSWTLGGHNLELDFVGL